MKVNGRQLIGLAPASLLAVCGYGKSEFDRCVMKEHAEQLEKTSSFKYPFDEYFPEIPVILTDPPRGGKHHTGEDSFLPPGTPVYAIGDGIMRYSGIMSGYGWLIVIDHGAENVCSFYGPLSINKSKKSSGDMKKGELIAYRAEAEEGETMVSHLHFEMRVGQRGDYPRWGDR